MRAVAIDLIPRHRDVLERLVRATSTPQGVAERARIVLHAADGLPNEEIGRQLGIDRQRARRWRTRWAEAAGLLMSAEVQGVSDGDLENIILDLIADEPRPGAPPKFTAEQLTALMALACREPSELGLPITHWSARDLARVAVKKGIVKEISPRHVARFFGGGRDSSSQVALLAQPSHRRSGRA
jgi:putative transposase